MHEIVASPADYLAATESAAIYTVPDPGYLLISGDTRREYLQRQTTNDIDLLTPTRVLRTLLTSPTGRILEFLTLLDLGDSIAMLTQPGHGSGLADYFQTRIFFNDKVSINDRSTDWVQFELFGPKAPEILKALGYPRVPDLDEVQTSNTEVRARPLELQTPKLQALRVIGQPTFDNILRIRLLAPTRLSDYLTTRLSDQTSLSFDSREILRIESGHPSNPEFAMATPFEIGMESLVSTTKGCYTGQEVLARQVTYDKVVRRLVRLRAAEPLTSGASLLADGKIVGQITSAAVSPRLGPIALALVRKPWDAQGSQFVTKDENGETKATLG